MIKAVIFDLDGVLIDSAPIVDVAREEAFALYGVSIYSIPDPHNQSHKGSSIKNMLGEVKRHTGIIIDEEDYSNKFTDFLIKGLASKSTTVDPKLLDLLLDLKQQRIKCAIATSSKASSLQVKMSYLQIHNFFKVIVTADDVYAHKPSPDIYIEAAKRLKLKPNECIVVEDSIAGVEAGVTAGCKVIGFTKYNQQQDKLPKTVLTIASWDEISATQIASIK